jgi:hypothetical protein
MPPPIFTDAYIRKMCPENHPVPLAKIPTFGATKPPQYLAKGYSGIKYVPPPHRPPRTVHTLARMMAGTSDPEKVRTQAAVVENFLTQSYQTANDLYVEHQVGAVLDDLVDRVEAEDEEETKQEVEVETTGPATPEGKGGGDGSVTPDSINKSTKGRDLGGGRETGGSAELDYSDEEGGAAEKPSSRTYEQLAQGAGTLTPLKARKPRSDAGQSRGPQGRTQERNLMEAEDTPPRTRAAKKKKEKYEEPPSSNLRGAPTRSEY